MTDSGTPDDPSGEQALRRQARQDATDFQNEMADLDVGRIRRFIPLDQSQRAQRDRDERRDRDWLLSLLGYERLAAFQHRLAELDRASIRALREAERRAETAEQQLQQIRTVATRDERGRLVYRTANRSSGFTDDGVAVAQDEFDRVIWREDAATWEERQRAGDTWREAIAERDAIGAYRDRLDTIRQRVDSGGPLDESELAELQKGAEDLPESVARELVNLASASREPSPSPGAPTVPKP